MAGPPLPPLPLILPPLTFALPNYRPPTKEENHAPAIARGARCETCPLYGCDRGPVMGEIRPNSTLTIVGEAPGKNEVPAKRPFVGWSGDILGQSLAEGGLSRGDTSITNVILCQPPGDGNYKAYTDLITAEWKKQTRAAQKRGLPLPPPPVMPHEACAPRLQRDIDEANAKTVMAVGKLALEATARELKLPHGNIRVQAGSPYVAPISKQHGAPVRVPDGRILVSSYHPAMAAPGREKNEWLRVIRKDLTAGAQVAKTGVIPWVPPKVQVAATLDDVLDFCDRLYYARAETAVDIETNGVDRDAHIRCIGMGAYVDGEEKIMVVPFRHMDGSPWWNSDADGINAAIAIRRVLDENPLIFQNGQFDTRVMLARGFMTNRWRTWFDCYVDSKTEFLTRRGWLKYDEVEPSDELGTLNKRGELEWQHYFKRVEKPFEGEVLDFETRRTRCVVTGNHRMYTRPVWRNGGRRGEWSFKPAEELVAGSPDLCETYRAFTPSEGTDTRMTVVDATLLGLWVAEGSIRWHNDAPYGIRISQKKDGRAQSLLESLEGFTRTECVHDEEWRAEPCTEYVWHRNEPALAQKFHDECGQYSADRRLPRYVYDQTKEVRAALLHALMQGDGTYREDSWVYPTKSRQLADDVQLLALTLGHPATRSNANCEGMWTVSIRPDLDQYERMGPRVRKSKKKQGRAYAHVTRKRIKNDRIVCFSVPNETLVTRVGGKVAFQGNTMVAHHDTPDNDLPHDLGFIARRKFILPMWKKDIDHKSVDNVNDALLHQYNGEDVAVTLRLVEPLREEMTQFGTWPQFDTDTKLAPILREMGEMGLVIDEAKRGEFSGVLNWQTQRELYQLRKLIERPKFNPRSVHQLQELLFGEWGYLPVIGTDGKEIKRIEGDDSRAQLLMEYDRDVAESEAGDDADDYEVGSTSSAALIALKTRNEMPPEHIKFIDGLLEYRAYDKLRSTYVDTLKVSPVDWPAYGLDIPSVGPVGALAWSDTVEDYAYREIIPARSAFSILYTTYKGHIVPTGRLATSPNIQNWPALGKANMRHMVVPAPGHVIVEGDYAQLEARLYAVAARDRLLLQAIADKKDIHSMNAATLLAKTLAEVDYWYDKVEHSKDKTYRKYWRTVAKRFAFLEIYGGDVETLFRTMASQRNKEDGELSFPNLQMSDVRIWHENWHTLHPETKWWHAQCQDICEQVGYASVPALDFRRRFFLAGASRLNQIANMTIQGFAASIANRALLRLVQAIPFRSLSPWTGVILQVHDALGVQVPIEYGEKAKAILEECMYYEFGGVAFPAEGGIARRWS